MKKNNILVVLSTIVGILVGITNLTDWFTRKEKVSDYQKPGKSSTLPKATGNSKSTLNPVVVPGSTAAPGPADREIPGFTLTVSNIIGFPQTAYTLKDELLGLPGFQEVRLSESSFQSDTKSAKYHIKFIGGDNKQLIRLIRSKIVIFTFDRNVKYSSERDIKMWVAF